MRVAVLDDYQHAARRLGDWSSLPGEVVYFSDHVREQAALLARLRGFEVIVAMRERTAFPATLLDALPDLRLLVTTGGSNPAIDLEAATRLGIVVSGTRGLDHPTVELTWALILAVARNVCAEDAAIREGRWQTALGLPVHGRTLGVVGLGRLGQEVARLGQAFGMDVIAWSQNLTASRAEAAGAVAVSKAELFETADVVSVHLRLSDRTRGVVDGPSLSRMKDTAILVNTSRAGVLDEHALMDVLRAGRIHGAGLDVHTDEPLAPGHPMTEFDNVILTPHVGYVTEDNYRVFFHDCLEDVVRYLEDDPVRVLNPAVMGSRR